MSLKIIFRFWLPLALSWLLMTVADPWVQAVIGRHSNAETQLAAFGLVMSLSVTIEAPIIMLLATSTALTRDRQAYHVLWRYMLLANLLVTLVAAAVAFTPLFDWWLGDILGIPSKIQEAARPGMAIMLFWSAAIGYRRFYQGILIRAGQTAAIGTGTVLRILVSAGLAALLGTFSHWSGVTVGAVAMVSSVVVEALYAVWRSRPALDEILNTPPAPNILPLTYRAILAFHLPLALTSLLSLLVRPVIESGLASTAEAERALAAWPVVYSILLMLRAGGFAYQEVVIALSKGPDETAALRRFGLIMGGILSLILIVLGFTPLIDVYAGPILSVPENVQPLVVLGTRAGILLPLLTCIQSYLRAMLMRTDTTPPIYQAMALNLLVTGITIWGGLQLGLSGLITASLSLTLAMLVEVIFLWLRFHVHASKLQTVWSQIPVPTPSGD